MLGSGETTGYAQQPRAPDVEERSTWSPHERFGFGCVGQMGTLTRCRSLSIQIKFEVKQQDSTGDWHTFDDANEVDEEGYLIFAEAD
jgi:hypothetical protein